VGQITVLREVTVHFSSSLSCLQNDVRTHQTFQKETRFFQKLGSLILTELTTHQTPTFEVMQRHFMNYKAIYRTPVFVTVPVYTPI
jgi:hypothetical protein